MFRPIAFALALGAAPSAWASCGFSGSPADFVFCLADELDALRVDVDDLFERDVVAPISVYTQPSGTGGDYYIEWASNPRSSAMVEQVADDSFELTRSGVYRVGINLLIEDADVDTVYRLHAMQDGIRVQELDRFGVAQTVQPDEYRYLSNSFLVESDGDDVLSFRLYNDALDDTRIYEAGQYAELSIEYLGR